MSKIRLAIFDALRAGASGYLLKDTSPDIIIEAIKGAYKGSVIMHQKIAQKIVNGSAKVNKRSLEEIKNEYSFSDREMSVMENIGNGLSNREILFSLFFIFSRSYFTIVIQLEY